MERHSDETAPVAYGIIAARINSSRLHGKILKPIDGKPMIQFQYERIKQAKTLAEVRVIVPEEDVIPIFTACANKIQLAGGAAYDVLDRFEKCRPTSIDTDVLVKFTDDSPLIDSKHIDNIVSKFLQDKADFGFLSKFPYGLRFNMCRVGALKKLVQNISKEDRAIWNQIDETWVWYKYGFKMRNYEAPFDFSEISFEVNWKEDLEKIRSVVLGEGDL